MNAFMDQFSEACHFDPDKSISKNHYDFLGMTDVGNKLYDESYETPNGSIS